ncbi:uncharacterized protein LOC111655713 [Seriola lalandi dorsalis]|uniref:uncharacterized protein LOC111655713 n=1 Tax=Seriola lalandi dorsalis TaxID=1841481 RepID=UPI000C6FBD81|nr:uncharacterized protein LOC111655713 [Seriola lalandi dorsalis]XP_056235842.1 uncharacterized protein LOC130171746 [Seriola aureovittata]
MVLTLVMTTGWTSWEAHKPPTQHHKTIHHSPQPPICQPSTSAFPVPDERTAPLDQHPRLPAQTAEEIVTVIYQGVDSPLCHPLKEEHEIKEEYEIKAEHTGNLFDQCPENKQIVCKICQNQFKNLLIHLKKSKTCQTHYDMDSLQKQAKVKRKSKHTEAQASYRRRQLLEDPITFRQKHALEQAASRLRNMEKDPIGTRAKHARVQAATRQKHLEKDPIGFRAKHARVQAATNKKNLDKDPIGTRAKHARVQAATRQKHLEKDPTGFRAKHARVQAATRQKILEKDPIEISANHATVQEATEQTNTRLQESQNKPTEAVKTEQEEVPCNLLTDLLCNDENDPTQFTFSCEVGEGHSSNGDGARSPERNYFPDSSKQHPSFICTAPKLDLSPLGNTTTVFLTGADYPGEEGSVQVPITVEVKTEADEQTPNTASPTCSLLNMPSPSPEWFTTEDSDLKPPVDTALQRAAEQQNLNRLQENKNKPTEALKTEQVEAPCSTYSLLLSPSSSTQ